MARPIAIRASCWRWARVRWSVPARSPGSPSTQGVGSSGLHLPRAAQGAITASQVARPSGSSMPLTLLIPSGPCGPTVIPRRRARSASVKSPSGCSRASRRAAAVRSPSGSCSARDAGQGGVGVFAGLVKSTASGRSSKNLRMIRTCSGPIRPLAWAAAVWVSFGANGSPGEGAAGAEVSGVLQPAVGFVAGDPQPLGEHGASRWRPIRPGRLRRPGGPGCGARPREPATVRSPGRRARSAGRGG